MDLNKENLRKIRGLILFTVIILVALWQYRSVLTTIEFFLRIVFPFLLGGAIAFILNVPMHFLENKLFYSSENAKTKKKKLARPLSLVLTILLMIGIVALVIFVVVPKLTSSLPSPPITSSSRPK